MADSAIGTESRHRVAGLLQGLRGGQLALKFTFDKFFVHWDRAVYHGAKLQPGKGFVGNIRRHPAMRSGKECKMSYGVFSIHGVRETHNFRMVEIKHARGKKPLGGFRWRKIGPGR